jgi:enoyl-CoA hydratase
VSLRPRDGMSIRVERPHDGVALVVIDSPATVNAITQGMLVDLAAAFRSLRGDPTVRAAVITATGRKAFSTGINLGDAERVFKMDENDLDNDIVHQMESCPFPVVGAVNGVAINAGFEIALACDVLMCSPNASFLDTHVKLGILPSWGLSQKLPRAVGTGAARVASLACRPIAAEEAFRRGLVVAVVPEKSPRDGDGDGDGGFVPGDGDTPALLAEALRLAREMAALPASGVRGYKRLATDGAGMRFADARAEERRRAFAQYRALPESFFAKMRAVAGLKPRARM